MKSSKTPVLLIGFNRPDNAQRVFNEIRKIKPKQFFLAVDGPRADKLGEEERCQMTRDITIQVDWDCEIKTLFQKKNLGCGPGVFTAIDWFFTNVEQGIIFEDDCLPDPSFFQFCQELLAYYRENEKIMMISGDNFQHSKKRGSSSYYFSEYAHIWGWATWRRAWKKYNVNYLLPDTYDKGWAHSMRDQKGLAIMPNVNLVSNIGFGTGATHTSGTSQFSNLPTRPIDFPLVHPKKVERNVLADLLTYRESFGGTYRKLLIRKILHTVPAPVKSRIKKILQK
jgi:hypothetical protein